MNVGLGGAGELVGAVTIAGALDKFGVDDAMAALRASFQVLDGTALGLPDEELRYARAVAVGRVWQGVGTIDAGPDRFQGREEWLRLFRSLGWVHPWARAPRPAPPFGLVRLYRGAARAKREGLSWTPSREVAGWFAELDPGGQVWQVDAPAGALLCGFPIRVGGLEGVEYVVDVAEGCALPRLAPSPEVSEL